MASKDYSLQELNICTGSDGLHANLIFYKTVSTFECFKIHLDLCPRHWETYARILASIDENHRDYTIRLLQFLTYSKRPLTIQEAVDVLVVDPNGDPPFDSKLRMPKPQEIMKICSSLVSLVTRQLNGETIMELQLAHFSVQQYLQSKQIEATFRGKTTEVVWTFQNDLNEIRARGSIRPGLAHGPPIGPAQKPAHGRVWTKVFGPWAGRACFVQTQWLMGWPIWPKMGQNPARTCLA